MTRTPPLFSVIALTSTAALWLVSGCAVGPDFKTPPAPSVKTYTENALPAQTTATDNVAGGASQTFAEDKDIPADWWKLFGSDPLNALMEQALKANPDLQAAQAALRQAQENLYAQQGTFYPAVDLTPSITREKISPASYGQPNAPSSLFTLYNASVSVSYGLDIFGGTRRTEEAFKAQAESARFQREAAYLTLTANIVTAAVQEASLREQIKATRDIIDLEHKQWDLIGKQFEYGAVAKAPLLAQEAVLAQAEATLPVLEKQLAQKRNQLAVLSGHLPGDAQIAAFDLTTLHLPEALPISIPSKLVEQRPDIKASEALLHSASAEIGVATANMLPQVTLNAGYGSQATTFSNLFSAPAEVWSVGGGLLQPLFRGGTLLHDRRASVAAYDKAAAQYQSTVLGAFQNVADTLAALQYDADALKAQEHASHAASQSLELSRIQLDAGAINYAQLLITEQTYQQSRIALAQARAARFADTAALFQSLGGGWWNRTEPAAKDTASLPQTLPANGDAKQ